MKIIVVRHGQTNYNVLELINCDPSIDVFLTEAGINEAKQSAERLKNEPLDAIFVSELPRTKQTAKYINQYHNVPTIVDKRLNDINTGLEGKSISEYHAERDAAEDAFEYKRLGAESSKDVYDRTKHFIDDLKKMKYQNVLIVTSKHNFRHFRSIIDNLDPRVSLKQQVLNTEILIREI